MTAKAQFRKRQENSRKRLSIKVARELDMMEDSLVEARDNLRERMDSFQPDLGIDSGGKRKLLSDLHVCCSLKL